MKQGLGWSCEFLILILLGRGEFCMPICPYWCQPLYCRTLKILQVRCSLPCTRTWPHPQDLLKSDLSHHGLQNVGKLCKNVIQHLEERMALINTKAFSDLHWCMWQRWQGNSAGRGNDSYWCHSVPGGSHPSVRADTFWSPLPQVDSAEHCIQHHQLGLAINCKVCLDI